MYENARENYFPPNFQWLISRKQAHGPSIFFCFFSFFISILSIHYSLLKSLLFLNRVANKLLPMDGDLHLPGFSFRVYSHRFWHSQISPKGSGAIHHKLEKGLPADWPTHRISRALAAPTSS